MSQDAGSALLQGELHLLLQQPACVSVMWWSVTKGSQLQGAAVSVSRSSVPGSCGTRAVCRSVQHPPAAHSVDRLVECGRRKAQTVQGLPRLTTCRECPAMPHTEAWQSSASTLLAAVQQAEAHASHPLAVFASTERDLPAHSRGHPQLKHRPSRSQHSIQQRRKRLIVEEWQPMSTHKG